MAACSRWSGRVALVTGASSGIGAAIANELVLLGMKVVGCARKVEKIEVRILVHVPYQISNHQWSVGANSYLQFS